MNYIRSNQSQDDFCKENNFSKAKLRYWYQRYKQEDQGEELIVPIKVDEAPFVRQPEEVKISFSNGMVVQFLSSEPENIIRSLLTQI